MAMRRVGVVVTLCLAAFIMVVLPDGVASAGGVTTEVFPGPNAIQSAVDAGSAGDTLLIHTGIYRESVSIGKAGMRLQAYGDGPVTVDAECGAFATIYVVGDAVRIEGLRIRGGTYYEVDFEFVWGGAVTRSILRDSCSALYGVNVFGTIGTMTVTGNAATGFGDAGIYIGGISSTSAVVSVSGNYALGNNRGIIVEDIVPAATVTVTGNTAVRNRAAGESLTNAGIFLHNADGVLIDANLVRENDDRGIALDANSSANVVTNNTASGHTYDLSNLGSGNCFSGNTYATSIGPLPACT